MLLIIGLIIGLVFGPLAKTNFVGQLHNQPVAFSDALILRLGKVSSSLILGLTYVQLLPSASAVGPRYVPKWKKQACEAPATRHPGSHFVCNEAGELKCLPGWTGDLCDVPICRKGCDPLQGYCKRPNECRCKLGYFGELCDKCLMLPGCQHGRCNVSFECACDQGWKGLFCHEAICASDCHPSQGYCEKPGECRCRLGWRGPMCKQCDVMPGCVHGTCHEPLECRCEPGWTGLLCSIPICSTGCSREHGYCRRPGTCRCRVGYTGANCTECVPYPGCAHGSCVKPWECRCEPGWTGDLCDEKLTYCDEHPGICQNSATCISMTPENGNYSCVCPLGFYGRQCEKEAEVPATDLIPPMLQETLGSSLNTSLNIQSSSTSEATTTIEEETAEPLGPIVITDPPSTASESPQTAGKWPPEPPTDSPLQELDADNET